MAKYARGERITDPMVALALIIGGQVVFWNNKAQNAAWLQNSQIRMIVNAVRRGIIYHAVLQKGIKQ